MNIRLGLMPESNTCQLNSLKGEEFFVSTWFSGFNITWQHKQKYIKSAQLRQKQYTLCCVVFWLWFILIQYQIRILVYSRCSDKLKKSFRIIQITALKPKKKKHVASCNHSPFSVASSGFLTPYSPKVWAMEALPLSLILTSSVMKQIKWSDSWFDRKWSDTNKE